MNGIKAYLIKVANNRLVREEILLDNALEIEVQIELDDGNPSVFGLKPVWLGEGKLSVVGKNGSVQIQPKAANFLAVSIPDAHVWDLPMLAASYGQDEVETKP